MLKVMTWNVENLFRRGTPSGPRDQATYDTKLKGLASTINSQAPDVLAVQEIGQPEALEDLVGQLSGAWTTTLSNHPDGRGIRVGWLTRSAVTHVEQIIDLKPPLTAVQVDDKGTLLKQMGRGALAVQLTTNGQTLHLVTAHLKSKLLEFPNGRFEPHDEDERARVAAYALFRRAAEAATVREWVTSALGNQGQQRALILAGDLNDTPEAATTELLFGPPGSQMGTRAFNIADKGDGQRLWDLAPRMPAGADYSRTFEGRQELIDHILVSDALAKKLQSAQALVDTGVPSIGVNPNARRDAPSSDHAPVVASFDF